MTDHPVSEYISLSNLNISGRGSIFSEKFLRIQICNSYINKISVMLTDKYIQSIDISHCRFVGSGEREVISGKDGYDISMSNNHFERTGRIVDIKNVNGISFVCSLIESCDKSAIKIDGVNSLLFNGNYIEANLGPVLELGSDLGRSRGVSIFGNVIKGLPYSEKNRYEILLGRAIGVASGGNYCSGNLYDTSYVALGGLQSMADVVQGRLASTDYPVSIAAAGTAPKAASLDLSAGSQGVPVINSATTVIRGATELSHTVALPATVSDGFQREITVVNAGNRWLLVLPQRGGAILGVDKAVRLEAGSAKMFVEYEPSLWCVV